MGEPNLLIGITDSDWASNKQHRHSVSGYGCLFAGGAVYYKIHFQKGIALSSTEEEFSALCDAAKIILYIRTVLKVLGVEQHHATPLFEDNRGCILIIESGHLTRRVLHVDLKQFSVLDWVSRDLINVKSIKT